MQSHHFLKTAKLNRRHNTVAEYFEKEHQTITFTFGFLAITARQPRHTIIKPSTHWHKSGPRLMALRKQGRRTHHH